MSTLQRWCFTLNNYTKEEEDHIKAVITEDTVKFAVIGRETGDSGTPHLQGYVNMTKVKRHTGMRKLLGKRAYITGAKGNDVENDTYCSKGADIMLRIGEPVTVGQNKVPFRMAVMAEMYEDNPDISFKEMGKEWYTCWGLHNRKIKEMVEHENMLKIKKELKSMYENVIWKPWQQEVIETLETFPDPRKVIWIWEYRGGVGKTYMTGYLEIMKNALTINSTSMKDVSYAYKGQPIVVFDIARHVLDFVNYGTIEAIKNGSIFSPKYESANKRYKIPHVLIFANDRPDESKMSADRWDIREIKSDEEDYEILDFLDE